MTKSTKTSRVTKNKKEQSNGLFKSLFFLAPFIGIAIGVFYFSPNNNHESPNKEITYSPKEFREVVFNIVSQLPDKQSEKRLMLDSLIIKEVERKTK